jgi:peptidyl-prolyl cis-trans isomerase C
MSMLYLVLLLAQIGCGDATIVIAEVGEVKLTHSDYEIFVGNLSGGQNIAKSDRETQAQYLQSMVDQELLLWEARDRQLHEAVSIKAELKFLARRRLAELFQLRVISSKIEIPLAELEREFVDSQFHRERLLSRILVRSAKDRDRVLAELAAGQAFTELLEPFAPNDAIAEGDGVVGWFNYADAERRFRIPQRIFFSLALDQVAEPVQLPRGWQIFRFLDERTPELQDYYPEVRRLVQQRKWQAGNREELELLKNKHAVKFHPQALTQLLDNMRGSTIRAVSLSPEQGKEALYTFADGTMDLNEAVGNLLAQGLSGAPPESTVARALFEDLLLKPMLFERAAKERGWDQDEEFTVWYQQQRKKVILNSLMNGEAKAKVRLNDGEVEEYYAANRDRFRTSAQVKIREVSANTAQAAGEFRRQLEAGAPIGKILIRRDVETHGRPRTGEMTLYPILKSRYPVLVEAAFAAGEGEWVGPLQTTDGHYVVFQVLEARGTEIESFDKARPRVEALLRQQREKELIGRFINQLRDKYADRVILYPDRLALDSYIKSPNVDD